MQSREIFPTELPAYDASPIDQRLEYSEKLDNAGSTKYNGS